MKKLFILALLMLSSCSSCSKKKDPNADCYKELEYSDFKEVDDDCDNSTDETYKDYVIRMRIEKRLFYV